MAVSAFTYRRTYVGPVQGVILDWAGTTIDYGCIAPAQVFIDVFAQHQVAVTMAEARAPMGMSKRDHIREVMHMPTVAERWRQATGSDPDESAVDALYAEFIPAQLIALRRRSQLIPGVVEAAAEFRRRGLAIGTCTGYNRAMVEIVAAEAAVQGFQPDALVCSNDVPAGRPEPWMCFLNAQHLRCYPMHALVKIGDTWTDVAEGLNAGMWTIAVAATGNELGLTQEEASAVPPDQLRAQLDAIYERFYQLGAHYVVDSIANVPPVLDAINDRLRRGETP